MTPQQTIWLSNLLAYQTPTQADRKGSALHVGRCGPNVIGKNVGPIPCGRPRFIHGYGTMVLETLEFCFLRLVLLSMFRAQPQYIAIWRYDLVQSAPFFAGICLFQKRM